MTQPFIRKDNIPLGFGIEDQAAPHAIPIRHDLYLRMKAIADEEGISVAGKINEALREWSGER